MPRVFLPMALAVLLLSLCLGAEAQEAKPVGTEVLYVLTSTQLTSYDVDRTTGEFTQVGQVLTGPNSSLLVPSEDSRFIYLFGFDQQNNEHIWVYATDAMGAPQSPAIQDLSVSGVSDFEIDPNGKLAYEAQSSYNGDGQTVASVNVFSRNPATGLLSAESQVVATYPPNGPCGTAWSQEGWFYLAGFSVKGTAFYDRWYCTAYDTNPYSIYYGRGYDKKAGALGSETQILPSGGWAWFTAKNITYAYTPDGSASQIDIYPLIGGTAPLITCTEQMLEACGYASNALGDPAGEYVFLQVEPDYGEVDRIEMGSKMGSKKIVTTGNFVPETLRTISPDRAVLYTLFPNQQNPPIVDTYLFDTKTGTVRSGGVLQISSSGFSGLTAAVRK